MKKVVAKKRKLQDLLMQIIWNLRYLIHIFKIIFFKKYKIRYHQAGTLVSHKVKNIKSILMDKYGKKRMYFFSEIETVLKDLELNDKIYVLAAEIAINFSKPYRRTIGASYERGHYE
jgi:hypothetical protein